MSGVKSVAVSGDESVGDGIELGERDDGETGPRFVVVAVCMIISGDVCAEASFIGELEVLLDRVVELIVR